jgi:predicted lipid carrier protein YhbT
VHLKASNAGLRVFASAIDKLRCRFAVRILFRMSAPLSRSSLRENFSASGIAGGAGTVARPATMIPGTIMHFRRQASPHDALLSLSKLPVEFALTRAVRSLRKRRPDVFERLGKYQESIYVLAPTGWPFAFRLTPGTKLQEVRLVDSRRPGPFTVKITGELRRLVGLFDGSYDADSSFFSRMIIIEGATDAALAMHNSLEAAELRPSDLLGLTGLAGNAFNRLLQPFMPRDSHA